MLSALLSSYPDDDDLHRSDGKGGEVCDSSPESPAAAATRSSIPRKRIDFLRLQMRCPTIMGAEPGPTAHGLFAPNSASSGAFPLPRSQSVSGEIGSSSERTRHSGGDITRAPASTVEQGGGTVEISSAVSDETPTSSQTSVSEVVMGPDNVPLVKYEMGVFANTEQEDFEGFRKTKQLQHRLAKEAREGRLQLGEGSDRPLGRGHALLSMLPKPQSDPGRNQLDAPIFSVGEDQKFSERSLSSSASGGPRSPRSTGEGGAKGCASCTSVQGETCGQRSKSEIKTETGEEKDNKSIAGAKRRREQRDRSTPASAEQPRDTEHPDEGAKDEPGTSGPLFTLFADYNDDDEEEPSSSADGPVKEEGSPRVGFSRRPGLTPGSVDGALLAHKPKSPANGEILRVENSHLRVARPDHVSEVPTKDDGGTETDVWGLSEESRGGQRDRRGEQPQMVEGMSLREVRIHRMTVRLSASWSASGAFRFLGVRCGPPCMQ